MHHEHQNPRWWTAPYVEIARPKIFFSENNFHCENLADFAEHMVGYDPNGPEAYLYNGERNKLCRNHNYASRSRFAGGLNYLPMDSEGMIDGEKSEPDWESIMLCEFISSKLSPSQSCPVNSADSTCSQTQAPQAAKPSTA